MKKIEAAPVKPTISIKEFQKIDIGYSKQLFV